jgi:hypothetical protein
MPEIVSCPTCQQELRVPDALFGTTVRCPQCREMFTALPPPQPSGPAAQAAADPRSADRGKDGEQRVAASRSSRRAPPAGRSQFDRVEEEDEDHPRGPRDDYDDAAGSDRNRRRLGWTVVWVGLLIFLIGCLVFGLAVALALVGFLVAALLGGAGILTAALSAGSSSPNAGAAGAGGGVAVIFAFFLAVICYLILLVASLAEWILHSVAHFFMLWIPNQPGTGRRPLAIAALVLWFSQLALTLIGCGTGCMSGGLEAAGNPDAGTVVSYGGNCISLVNYGCAIAWFFVFAFLLRAIARGVGDDRLGRTVVIYMIVVPVVGVVTVLAGVGLACGGLMAMGWGATTGTITPATLGGLGIGWLIALGIYLVLALLIEIALWVWYVVILYRTWKAVARWLKASE